MTVGLPSHEMSILFLYQTKKNKNIKTKTLGSNVINGFENKLNMLQSTSRDTGLRSTEGISTELGS